MMIIPSNDKSQDFQLKGVDIKAIQKKQKHVITYYQVIVLVEYLRALMLEFDLLLTWNCLDYSSGLQQWNTVVVQVDLTRKVDLTSLFLKGWTGGRNKRTVDYIWRQWRMLMVRTHISLSV